MAIVPGVPGLKATILVRGQPTGEYVDDEDEAGEFTKQVTRYIISEEGADFAIKWEYDGEFPFPKDAIIIGIHLDDDKVDGTVQNVGRCQNFPTTIWKGARHEENGVWKERGFNFGKLVTREHGKVECSTGQIKRLGTVSIQFIRAVEGKPVINQSHTSEVKVGVESIHEKALKGQAMSHQVKMGKAKDIVTPPPAVRLSYPWGVVPFATFHFKYRSRMDLQALGLIPRSPSPTPLEDRPLEGLSREELQELVRQQRNRPRIKNEMKRERPANDDTDDENAVEVVHSRRSKKPLKVSINARTGIETVDLSED